MLVHGFCLFQYGLIKPLSMSILLRSVRNRSLMSDTFGSEEHLKLLSHKFTPLVWMHKGKSVTSKDLSSRDHIVKIRQTVQLGLQEGQKSIPSIIINESKNIPSMRVKLHRHRTNKVCVHQSKRAKSLLTRGWKGTIRHLLNLTALTRSKISRKNK